MTPIQPIAITIVGAGTVGTALGRNLQRHGHRVRYAIRETAKAPESSEAVGLDGCAVGSNLTLLAVPFGAIGDAVPRMGLQPGDVLIDATNPFGAVVPDGHPSGAAYVASLAGSGVHIVKTFNVLGAEHMSDPSLPDGMAPVLPVAADDDQVRADVVGLAAQMGFDAVGVGGLTAAAILENAAAYWGLLAITAGMGREMVLVAHQPHR